ncbi:MAG: hypothetical protein WD825_15365 [Gemmatimonadaceae bacterium]
MNTLLLAAAGLILLLGAAHSYLGERYILIRLFRRSDLPTMFGSDLFTRRTLRFAWHLTTVVWWGLAALLFVAARNGSGAMPLARVGAIVATTALASAVVAFVGSHGRHLSWLVFLAISMLAWLGTH